MAEMVDLAGQMAALRRTDPLGPEERSKRMARVRSFGNRSTEVHVAMRLVRAGIRGWKRNDRQVVGTPDFTFPAIRLAVFIDGCFWHGCPHCKRRLPRTRRRFWRKKLTLNKRRDRRVDRELRGLNFHVKRIWECRLRKDRWMTELTTRIDKLYQLTKSR